MAHKIILECETLEELDFMIAKINRPAHVYVCENRITLLRDLRTLYKSGNVISLTSIGDIVFKHVK